MPPEESPTASPVRWDASGTPHSQQFDDTYRSFGPAGDQGLQQSRHVFLHGCGLWPADAQALEWSGKDRWHVLETGFGLGLNFLATWHAWRQQAARPQRLFFTSIEAWPVLADDIRRGASAYPELHALAEALAANWRGLLPGVHRLEFDDGRVCLTLCIGPVEKMLRQPDVYADSVYLDGFSPEVNPQMWDPSTLKAVARLCRAGTRLASWCIKGTVRDSLKQCGFAVQRREGLPPKWHRLEARFEPHWTPVSRMRTPLIASDGASRSAMVLGAGLAGSAVAHSLALRGWKVTVLDQGEQPGAGASGLPAGIVAPHISADDGLLSRITRAGVRATLQRARRLLPQGVDWQESGVLEHQVGGKHQLPYGNRWPEAGHAWGRTANGEEKHLAGLNAPAQAVWHALAGWIRPRQWVAAQLAHPNISVHWGVQVASIHPTDGHWQALDASGKVLCTAPQVVVAGGYATKQLLDSVQGAPDVRRLPLDPLRGQITWGWMDELPAATRATFPPFPVNGHGSLIANVRMPDEWGTERLGWVLGSTFERNDTGTDVRPQDHAANREKLRVLLPALGDAMNDGSRIAEQSWAALRCALPDRLPAVGPIDPVRYPGLQVCVAMGARGISLSVLCAELLAAWLEAEPLPIEQPLATRLAATRFLSRAAAYRLASAGRRPRT